MSAYEKQIQYYFEVMDEGLVITSFGEDYAYIEETRKNGQEDTHMSNIALLIDGVWKWENDDFNSFEEYHSPAFAKAILQYLKVNGLPQEDIQEEVIYKIHS